MHTPKLVVRVPADGRAILTNVTIDGQEWPVTRVAFDTGESIDGFVKVSLEFIAGIDFESEVPLTLTSVGAR